MGAVAYALTSKAAPPALSQYTGVIEDGLRRRAFQPTSPVGRMIGYHFGWLDRDGRATRGPAGKFLRPSLCLWACRACGGSVQAALPAAIAVELVHNFTLIHDDIQDGDLLRRGRPTVWSIWGAAQAINAGDALHALAFNVLSSPADDPERASLVIGLISNALLRVIDGQQLDLSLEGRPSTSPLSYLRLIRLKTGALIGAAMEAGAISAGAPPKTAKAFRRAGVALGVAFQLRDDWLGVWGLAAETGKSNESDLSRHKLTFPVIAAYAGAVPARRAALERLYAERSPRSAEAMRALLLELGGAGLTADAARRPAHKALALLAGCGLHSSLVKEFSYVADYIADRNT